MPEITKKLLIDNTIETVQGIVSEFTEPTDDIDTLALITDGTELVIVDLRIDKPQWASAIVKVAENRLKGKASAVVTVNSVYIWEAPADRGKDSVRAVVEEFGSVEQVPGRTEAVLVGVIDADGVDIHQAPLDRHKDEPPTLGEFKHMDIEEAPLWGPVIDYMKSLK